MKTDPPAMTAISNVSDIEPRTNEDRESEEMKECPTRSKPDNARYTRNLERLGKISKYDKDQEENKVTCVLIPHERTKDRRKLHWCI
ncbi:hypothetical protein K438DRAFT_1809764 [Mycena galopus ATCC 62051]|nr:hypothetical protein K438DRAFT_1809764 [Mycena galopus ATCC 62051]